MVSAYYQAVLDVGHRLLWAFAVALGEDPDTFSKHATKTPSQLRLIHYPLLPSWRPATGCARSEERYSFPLFFNVDYHTEVKPLPQFASREGKRRPALRAGEDLFAQTGQTFGYLRHRVESGSLTLPDGSLETGQFGQQALQKRS